MIRELRIKPLALHLYALPQFLRPNLEHDLYTHKESCTCSEEIDNACSQSQF